MLRGSHGDAAGTQLGSSSAERAAANTGTVPGLPRCRTASAVIGLGPLSTDSVRDGAEPP